MDEVAVMEKCANGTNSQEFSNTEAKFINNSPTKSQHTDLSRDQKLLPGAAIVDPVSQSNPVHDSSAFLDLDTAGLASDLQTVLSTTSQFSSGFSSDFRRTTRQVEGRHASVTTFDNEFRVKAGNY